MDSGPLSLHELIRIPQIGTRHVPACFSYDRYEILYKVGEGTFGEVAKARERETGRLVAIKHLRTEHEKEGFPRTALREILILMNYRHPNIMACEGIAIAETRGKKEFYMVFDYMDHDLTGLLENPAVKWTSSLIKCYLKQLLEGVSYLHQHAIIHRDVKGSNILINNRGELKLGDFGLARLLDERQQRLGHLTNKVVTLWYRAPELLLGSTSYTSLIDMWSVGCIFAEILLRRPLFPGKDEMEQIQRICNVCGTPSETTWPGVMKYPFFKTFQLEPRPSTFYKEFAT
jgi:cyclin-dependent kinase 12/13